MNNERLITKKYLRQEVAQRIQVLDSHEILESDRRIRDHILSLAQYQEAKLVFCFVNTESEIDTKSLIKQALKQKKRVCIPRCISKGIMHAFEIESFDDLQDGKYGILEPKDFCGFVHPSDIDFAVIPCVTCNTQGYRLGYGGGFYDRYLKGQNFVTAVVCRSVLLSEDIPKESHDVQINLVVTDKCIYRCDQIRTKCSEKYMARQEPSLNQSYKQM